MQLQKKKVFWGLLIICVLIVFAASVSAAWYFGAVSGERSMFEYLTNAEERERQDSERIDDLFPGGASGPDGTTLLKPVIYLYPEATTDVHVQLEVEGELIADYPEYSQELQGWNVEASPDGTLVNHADGEEYSYLFWEADYDEDIEVDSEVGFVVAGTDTREFLRDTLDGMGLTPREYNEFIVYWYPLLKDNPYNFIHFAQEEYTSKAPLTITPAPDSMLRVFMVYEPLEQPRKVQPQQLESFERTGFTVVEWGGRGL